MTSGGREEIRRRDFERNKEKVDKVTRKAGQKAQVELLKQRHKILKKYNPKWDRNLRGEAGADLDSWEKSPHNPDSPNYRNWF